MLLHGKKQYDRSGYLINSGVEARLWRMKMTETDLNGWIPEIRNLKLEIGELI
jgi:hypothetical protein